MTGVTPKAGASPQGEDGPGAALAGHPSPWSAQVLLGATASIVIGRVGAQAAGLALRLSPSGPADMLDIAVVDKGGSTLLRLGPFAEVDVIAARPEGGWEVRYLQRYRDNPRRETQTMTAHTRRAAR